MPKNSVVVFDLDDTLYKEIDYQTSGLKFISNYLNELFCIDCYNFLLEQRNNSVKDLWGGLCTQYDLSPSIKETLLWMYRLHSPTIELESGARKLLSFLFEVGIPYSIVTDGRSITQRLKVKALGLDGIPLYISDEYDGVKPMPQRFQLIENNNPENNYYYIADNIKKDFITPNKLGWTTICLRDDGRNIHTQSIEGIDRNCLPDYWVDDLIEVINYLC